MAAAFAFSSVAGTGVPIAIGTSATVMHVTRAGVTSEVSLIVFSVDTVADRECTLLFGGTPVSVATIEKLAGGYVILPPSIYAPGVTISTSASASGKLFGLPLVSEYA